MHANTLDGEVAEGLVVRVASLDDLIRMKRSREGRDIRPGR